MAKGNTRDPARERAWRQAIREQARSGLTIRTFCHQNQLAESAFYFWRRELQRRREQRKSRPKASTPRPGRRGAGTSRRSPGIAKQVPTPTVAPAFVPVHLARGDGPISTDAAVPRYPAEPSSACTDEVVSSIQIALPGGARIHVHSPVDRQALADVVAALVAAGVVRAPRAEHAEDGVELFPRADHAAHEGDSHEGRPC